LKIKVLHLCTATSWRGGEQQLAYLLTQIDAQTVQAFVLCKKGSAFEAFCVTHQIAHLALKFSSSYNLFVAKKIARITKKMCIDFVHVHGSHGHTLAVLSNYFGMKSKIIVHKRANFGFKENWFSRKKYTHKSIIAYISISQIIADNLRKYLGNLSSVPIYKVYSGISLERFKEKPATNVLKTTYQLPEDSFLVGNISALTEEKDWHTFLKTAQNVTKQYKSCYFFIVGKGALLAEIEQLIVSMGLDGRVFCTGFRTDISDVLQCLDVFLLTSSQEGLGTTVLDAFACRVAVVATSAGGIPEMVFDEKTGLLASVGDFVQLSAHIARLYQDRILSEELSAHAFDLLEEQFTAEKMASAVLAIYKELKN